MDGLLLFGLEVLSLLLPISVLLYLLASERVLLGEHLEGKCAVLVVYHEVLNLVSPQLFSHRQTSLDPSKILKQLFVAEMAQ